MAQVPAPRSSETSWGRCEQSHAYIPWLRKDDSAGATEKRVSTQRPGLGWKFGAYITGQLALHNPESLGTYLPRAFISANILVDEELLVSMNNLLSIRSLGSCLSFYFRSIKSVILDNQAPVKSLEL